ncbi:hypothetical protein E2986_10705 [Frieseomelitta varia]|uniref:Uncharacterized protein n=1 Tax=Frieseomelitta varia TaxID=561572 RepID=A0A833S4V0_9HYME|nr:hypothetical protein E2986_10705 [Frieseomelitta varia]
MRKIVKPKVITEVIARMMVLMAQAKQIINLLLLNNFYTDEFETKATNYCIYGLVTRYGPQSVASARTNSQTFDHVQLVYCMTISTYTKPEGFFNIGLTAGQAWQLPSKSTLSNKLGDYHRRSRRQLYRKMELLLESQGKDGKACVLKTICNAAGRSQTEIGKGHFMQEILHAMFSLPASYNDADPMTEYERAYFLKENCNEARRKCPDTAWQTIVHVY